MKLPEEKLPCRKCLIASLPQGDKQRQVLQERLEQIPEEERVSSDVYAERLACCFTCRELHERTCALCGCYAELRAARKDKNCPDRRWATEECK